MKLGLCVAMALVLAFESVVANPLKAEEGEGEDNHLDTLRVASESDVDSEEGGLEDRNFSQVSQRFGILNSCRVKRGGTCQWTFQCCPNDHCMNRKCARIPHIRR